LLFKFDLEPYAYNLRRKTYSNKGPNPSCLGTHLPLCRLQMKLLPAGGFEVTCSSSHLDPTRSFHNQRSGRWFKSTVKTKMSFIEKSKKEKLWWTTKTLVSWKTPTHQIGRHKYKSLPYLEMISSQMNFRMILLPYIFFGSL
jgi:hypothetical protein